MAVSSTLVATDAVAGQEARVQMLRFALGSEQCAVRISSVREILNMPRTTPLPLLPGFVRGVMNLRGAVVPVIDLADRLGLEPVKTGRRSCVVIVELARAEAPPQAMGILVDAVYEVFDAAPEDFETVPRIGTRIEPALILDMVRSRDKVLSVIHLEAAFDPTTMSELLAGHQYER